MSSKLDMHDTCDRCGATAMLKVSKTTGATAMHLTFCAHHGVTLRSKLEMNGFAVTDARSGDD